MVLQGYLLRIMFCNWIKGVPAVGNSLWDRFELQLVASELVSSELKGRLGLPFKGETTTLAYEGFMQMNDRYTLVVRPDSSLNFSIFNAEAQLDPSSYVKLDLIDDKFVPEAVLHGRMALGKTEGLDDLKGSESVKLASLKFVTSFNYQSTLY